MRLLSLIVILAPCSAPAQTVTARLPAFLDAKALKALPHVHTVEILPASKEPKRQIIHILNWHYVTFSEFEADLRAAEGKPKPNLLP